MLGISSDWSQWTCMTMRRALRFLRCSYAITRSSDLTEKLESAEIQKMALQAADEGCGQPAGSGAT